MAMSTRVCTAAAASFRRLFSRSVAAASGPPLLLGHFHHPVRSGEQQVEEYGKPTRKRLWSAAAAGGGGAGDHDDDEVLQGEAEVAAARGEPFFYGLLRKMMEEEASSSFVGVGLHLNHRWPTKATSFLPATAASPNVDLSFMPDSAIWLRFTLVDSHRGLLLVYRKRAREEGNPEIFVCDPLLRRYAHLPDLPKEALATGNVAVGTALLSRAAAGFSFEVVLFTFSLATGRPRAWIVCCNDGGDCSSTWQALPPAEDVCILDSDVEHYSVHAAGHVVWHRSDANSAVMLNTKTMEFSVIYLPDPAFGPCCRIGEDGAGRLICATLMPVGDIVRLFVWEEHQYAHFHRRLLGGTMMGRWIQQTEIRLQPDVFESMKPNLFLPGLRLTNFDAAGNVFIRNSTGSLFSYNLDDGELRSLTTDPGFNVGHPTFPYHAAAK